MNMVESNFQIQFAAVKEYDRQHGIKNLTSRATFTCVLPGLGVKGADYVYTDGCLGAWWSKVLTNCITMSSSFDTTGSLSAEHKKMVDDWYAQKPK